MSKGKWAVVFAVLCLVAAVWGTGCGSPPVPARATRTDVTPPYDAATRETRRTRERRAAPAPAPPAAPKTLIADAPEAPKAAPPARATTSPRGQEAAVAEYLERLMALEDIQPVIARAYQPDPDVALVYVDFKSGASDWVIEGLVRTMTEGVHNNSSTGIATVVAQVRGITVAEGNYKVFSGSIEVKLLR